MVLNLRDTVLPSLQSASREHEREEDWNEMKVEGEEGENRVGFYVRHPKLPKSFPSLFVFIPISQDKAAEETI